MESDHEGAMKGRAGEQTPHLPLHAKDDHVGCLQHVIIALVQNLAPHLVCRLWVQLSPINCL